MQAMDTAALEQGANSRRLRPSEVKGYEQMLSRMLDAPLQSSEKNQNWALQQKLLKIKNQLGTQGGLMAPIPNMLEHEASEEQQTEETADSKQDEGDAGDDGIPAFMKAQHDHLERLRREMESQLPGYNRPTAPLPGSAVN